MSDSPDPPASPAPSALAWLVPAVLILLCLGGALFFAQKGLGRREPVDPGPLGPAKKSTPEEDHLRSLEGRRVYVAKVYGMPPNRYYHSRPT